MAENSLLYRLMMQQAIGDTSGSTNLGAAMGGSDKLAGADSMPAVEDTSSWGQSLQSAAGDYLGSKTEKYSKYGDLASGDFDSFMEKMAQRRGI
jgi:hypothetical protein